MSEHADASAPTLPEPRDEAAPTPLWMPVLGAVLVALLSLWVVFRVRTAEQLTADEAAKQAARDGDEPAAGAPHGEAAAAAAPSARPAVRAEPAPALRARPAP